MHRLLRHLNVTKFLLQYLEMITRSAFILKLCSSCRVVSPFGYFRARIFISFSLYIFPKQAVPIPPKARPFHHPFPLYFWWALQYSPTHLTSVIWPSLSISHTCFTYQTSNVMYSFLFLIHFYLVPFYSFLLSSLLFSLLALFPHFQGFIKLSLKLLTQESISVPSSNLTLHFFTPFSFPFYVPTLFSLTIYQPTLPLPHSFYPVFLCNSLYI